MCGIHRLTAELVMYVYSCVADVLVLVCLIINRLLCTYRCIVMTTDLHVCLFLAGS